MKSRDWLAVRHHRHERWPLVDQRVHYTWESTTARPTFPLAAKSSRLISFTDAPFSDFRASSPIPILNDGFSSDGPMPHKTSRGESGFESSDGGLTDYGAGFGRKDEKVTRSASEKNSEISIGSYGSVENCYGKILFFSERRLFICVQPLCICCLRTDSRNACFMSWSKSLAFCSLSSHTVRVG